jgi:putative hydrolase of the HAD superfamily
MTLSCRPKPLSVVRSAILLDLDDTLFEELSYVRSGFAHVARLLAADTGRSAQRLSDEMWSLLAAHGRGRVFDTVLANAGLEPAPDRIRQLVAAYRAHRPSISLYEGVDEVLRTLRARCALAVVTDGDPGMQRRKVEALRVAELVDVVTYCLDHGAPKPSVAAYRHALKAIACEIGEVLVVGDDVTKDLPAAEALNARFVRVRTGRYRDLPMPPSTTPVHEIASIRDLPGLIMSL